MNKESKGAKQLSRETAKCDLFLKESCFALVQIPAFDYFKKNSSCLKAVFQRLEVGKTGEVMPFSSPLLTTGDMIAVTAQVLNASCHLFLVHWHT